MNSSQVFAELRRIAPHLHLMGSQVRSGFVDVGESPVVLGTGALLRGVLLQVDRSSVESVWVVAGEDLNAGDGISLDAGDRYFFLPVSDLNQVWLVAEHEHAVRVNYWAI